MLRNGIVTAPPDFLPFSLVHEEKRVERGLCITSERRRLQELFHETRNDKLSPTRTLSMHPGLVLRGGADHARRIGFLEVGAVGRGWGSG